MTGLKRTVRTRLAVVAVTAALVLSAVGVGIALGYRPVVITSGSMGPAVPTGALAIAQAQPASGVEVGDVIVMDLVGSTTVTHRVVDITGPPLARAAVTRGDANASTDAISYPLDGDALVVVRVIPTLGTVVAALGSPLIAVMIVLAGLAWLSKSRRPPELRPATSLDEPPATSREEPSARQTARKAAAAGLLLVVGLGAVSITSLALFTDSEVIADNTFTTGTLDIAASPVSAVVAMTGMVPGDDVTAPLAVANNGSLDFRYSMTSTTTEDVLADLLRLTVKTGVTGCDDIGWSADGTVVYDGTLGASVTQPVLGSRSPGADPGDRELAPGESEELCLRVALPLSVTNEAQGLSTEATFTLDAEQTANNP